VSLSFLMGTMGGGLTTAVGLWIIGGLFEPLSISGRRVTLLIALALLIGLRGMGSHHVLPQVHRQVPTSVFEKDFRVAAFGFGFELGTGARTYVSSLGPYALALGLVLLRPSVDTCIAVGLAFGMGRWSSFLLGPQVLEAENRSTGRLRFVTAAMSGVCFLAVGGLSIAP
jgi:hypothetical protein